MPHQFQVFKTGVVYSNKVFVGTLHTRMSERDVKWILRQNKHYPEDVKVIRDVHGCSKGIGILLCRLLNRR